MQGSRDAFVLLSKLSYKKFGAEVLSLIEEASYKLGAADGEKLAKEKNAAYGELKATMEAFLTRLEKAKLSVEASELPGGSWRIRGYKCPLGLENTTRELCQAMMASDRGMFERASGKKISLKIVKTVAEGDPYCEAIWSIEE